MKNPGGYIGEALTDAEWKSIGRKKRKAQPTEAKVKKAVAEWLKRMGLRHFRMQSGQIMGQHKGKPWMMRLCPPGTPDYIVIRPVTRTDGHSGHWYDGSRVTWIEVKRPLGPKGGTGGSEQSPEQVAFQAEAERNGERYLVVRSVSDLVEGLK